MKEIISTPKAPSAIGPYNQATAFDKLIFTSGQIALDPVSMEIVAGGVQEQTKQVMENLKAVLEEAGSSFENVLKEKNNLKTHVITLATELSLSEARDLKNELDTNLPETEAHSDLIINDSYNNYV